MVESVYKQTTKVCQGGVFVNSLVHRATFEMRNEVQIMLSNIFQQQDDQIKSQFVTVNLMAKELLLGEQMEQASVGLQRLPVVPVRFNGTLADLRQNSQVPYIVVFFQPEIQQKLVTFEQGKLFTAKYVKDVSEKIKAEYQVLAQTPVDYNALMREYVLLNCQYNVALNIIRSKKEITSIIRLKVLEGVQSLVFSRTDDIDQKLR